MKTLVLSDVHLGRKFDQKKLDFLHSLFSMYDKVILNGDFWCYYSFDFSDFVNSKWNNLFPILKKKDTVYIYGNHDKEIWCDERVNLFSQEQANSYAMKFGNRDFLIEHGDSALSRLCLTNRHFVRFMRNVNPLIFELIDKTALNTYPFLDNIMPFILNRALKKRAIQSVFSKPNSYYITGHTHYPEFDENSRYINTGYVGNKLAQYLELATNHSELFSVQYK